MFEKRSGSISVMSSSARCPGRLAKIARATWSRGLSSSTKRLPVRAVQRRALAAYRLGDQEALAAFEPDHRGGVELRELEVRELSARRPREDEPEPNDPGGFVVRDHSAAAPPVASSVARAAIGSPSPVSPAGTRITPPPSSRPPTRRPSRISIRGCSAAAADSARRIRRPVALPPAWMMRRRRWPAFEAEREVAVAVGVELAAQVLQLTHAGGRPRS